MIIVTDNYGEPLISVIVAVYNIDCYVEQCVASICSQSYGNLEILLVNDGSTDQSGKICDKLALNDERIKVYHKTNGGLSDARNFGIAHVKGRYVSFVDGDDVLHEKFYEVLASNAVRTGADISMCFIAFEYPELLHIADTPKLLYYNEYFESTSSLTAKVVVWNKIYRKEIFDQIRFAYGKKHEDVFIYGKLLWGRSFVITQSKLYYYRQREGSITKTLSSGSLQDRLTGFNNLVYFFKKKHIKSQKVFRDELGYFAVIKFYKDGDRIMVFRNLMIIFKSSKFTFREKINLLLTLMKVI